MEDFGRNLGGAGIAAMLPVAPINPMQGMSTASELQNLINLQNLQSLMRAQPLIPSSNGLAGLSCAAQVSQNMLPTLGRNGFVMDGLAASANNTFLESTSVNTLKQSLSQNVHTLPSLANLAASGKLALGTPSPTSQPFTPVLPIGTVSCLSSSPSASFGFGNGIANLFSNSFGVPEGTPMLTKRRFLEGEEEPAFKVQKISESHSPASSAPTTPSSPSEANCPSSMATTPVKAVKICGHGRRAGQCKDCGASNVCEHGRRRSRCKDCGGTGICVHNRQRNYCKDCGGSGICEHKRKRSLCKDCGGSSICEHKRQRSRCKECGGSQICPHGRRKSLCKDCGGSQICEHRRQRSLCKDCGGSQICVHKRRKRQCKECAEINALKAAEAAAAEAP